MNDATLRIDGVVVEGPLSAADLRRRVLESDVLFAQLGDRMLGLRLAARYRRPLVYFVHIGNVPRRALAGRPSLTVFNSEVLRAEQAWIRDALVVHPPITESDYRTDRGSAVTLVNLSEAKGGRVLAELACRQPQRRFLGVRGSIDQELPDGPIGNVEIIGPVSDMREVYRQTRVLLVPSAYESYGRVALEAAASGIPTIAHPTPGLVEALGPTAMFADRDDLVAWQEWLTRLDDPAEYEQRSRLARARFDELSPSREIDALEARLVALAQGTS
jgi:hypothetical protein